MPRINRGSTTKLSIRLSLQAKKKISDASFNLGTSKAGVILMELVKLLKNPPSKQEILNLSSTIVLEKDNFPVTINQKVSDRVNYLTEQYGMKKNALFGYMLSAHFDPEHGKDFEQTKVMVHINESFHKKIMDYCESNYISFSAIVAYSVLKGPFDGFPSYKDPGKMVDTFTNVPGYVLEEIKQQAEERHIRENFYVSLCLYKQFMTPEGNFFE